MKRESKSSININVKSIELKNDLILSILSAEKHPINEPEIHFIDTVDLKMVKNIDSAGLAYLALLKILNPKLSFSGYSEKIVLLSRLYGLNFLFYNENENTQ